MEKILNWWRTLPVWARRFVSITSCTIGVVIILKVIFATFFVDSVNRNTLPGFFGYLILVALLVIGVVTGEKNNRASLIMALSLAGVLLLFFSPTLTSWARAIFPAGTMSPEYFFSGLILLAIGVATLKFFNLPRLATFLFFAGIALIALAFIGPHFSKELFSNVRGELSESASAVAPELKKFVTAVGVVKTILIVGLTFLLVKLLLRKKPRIIMAIIVALMIFGVYEFSSEKILDFYSKELPPEVHQVVNVEKDSGKRALVRIANETKAEDRKRNIKSRGKVSNAGNFYINKDARICMAITTSNDCDEVPAEDKKGTFGLKEYLKVFVIEGQGIPTYDGQAFWERVEIGGAGGRPMYVFSGDLKSPEEILGQSVPKGISVEQAVDLKVQNNQLESQIKNERNNWQNQLDAQRASSNEIIRTLKEELSRANNDIVALKTRVSNAQAAQQRAEKAQREAEQAQRNVERKLSSCNSQKDDWEYKTRQCWNAYGIP